ncbi:MAG: hypothetical protein M3Z33_03415 [Actinomycetota bacterium]|nr:hypothetical protein [Actinomycetota bacterium]
MTGSTRQAGQGARLPARQTPTLTYVFHALPYVLVFAMHMGAVLGLVGVFGGTGVVRTLMAGALLLAALVLLFATPARRRPPGHRVHGRRTRPIRRTAARPDDRELARARRERVEARELARARKRQYGAE